jgi:hypothetical protein
MLTCTLDYLGISLAFYGYINIFIYLLLTYFLFEQNELLVMYVYSVYLRVGLPHLERKRYLLTDHWHSRNNSNIKLFITMYAFSHDIK